MLSDLHICLYEPASVDGSFRAPFDTLEGITVVEHCTAWHTLQEHLRFGNVKAVAVDLDQLNENPRFITIQRIVEIAPECAIIGVSKDTSPDTIIGAMRAGCVQFVRKPIDTADLREALDRVRCTGQTAGVGGERIAVIGSAGGAGSTTIACNLALELARVTEQRAALVDMNLQFGDIACAFDVVPKYSVADVCRKGVNIDNTLLEGALDALPCNVSILARPESLEDAEEVSPDAVEQLFQHLAQMFRFTVIDLPRHFSLATIAAMRSANRVLVISQLAVPFLRNATRIYQHLLQAGVNEDHIEFVLNRCNAEHERIKPEEVEKHFGRPVFATIPNDYKRVTASRDLGHPILTAAPNSSARLAIQNLAQKLAFPDGNGAENAAGERGFLGLFRKKRGKVAQTTVQHGIRTAEPALAGPSPASHGGVLRP